MPDGSAHPGMQLTVINSRAALLVAQDPDRRMLAGDQLYVDLDLSPANLPAGTRLAVGSAVIEVSEEPHLGCAKFAARFGKEALRFVNSRAGRGLRLRGLNARILTSGTVRPGDRIRKLPPANGAAADGPELAARSARQPGRGNHRPSVGWDLPDGNQAQAESDAQGENHGPMARFRNEQLPNRSGGQPTG